MEPLYPIILRKALEVGEQKAKGFCTSRQLRASMYRKETLSTGKKATGRILVPQYWAKYKHNGRDMVKPVSANMLVWFRDPKDDPRLTNGQSPIYRSEIKALTNGQWKYWSGRNKRARRAKQPVPMIVRKSVGPMASQKRNPFFSDAPGGGLAGLPDRIDSIASRESFKYVDSWLRSTGLKRKHVKTSI